MNIQLLNYIIQPLLGGAAGYITNEYAINMLFNTYTPLKIGGVIPKTKNEFIENITKLIEEDLINKEKVEAIINDKVFIDNFNTMIDDFYNNSLYEATNNITINNLSCFNSCIPKIKEFKSKELEVSFSKLISCVLKNIRPDEIIDKDHIENITNSIYDYIFKILSSTTITDNIVDNYMHTNVQLSLRDILGKDVSDKITASISNNIINQKHEFKDMDVIINKILTKTRAYELIYDAIKDFVQNSSDKFTTLINNIINKYIESTNSKELVYKLSNSITAYTKNVNVKISDLLSTSYRGTIKKIVYENYNDIVKILLSFVEINNSDIKFLINTSVEETINDQDSGKKFILNMAKGTIQSKIDTLDIKELLDNLLNSPEAIDNLTDLLCKKVDEFLSRTTVSELITILEEKDILTSKKLSSFIYKLIGDNTDKLGKSLIQIILNAIDNSVVRNMLNHKIVKFTVDKIILSDTFDKSIIKCIKQLIDSFLDKDLNDIIELLEKNNISTTTSVIKLLENNRSKILNALNDRIYSFISDTSLYELMYNNSIDIDSLATLGQKYIDNRLDNLIDEYSKKDLYEIFNSINKIDNIQASSAEALRKLIIDNLGTLLQSFIKALSVNNLNKLNDEELCDMAKSFMGNNLKPIMYFGGLLGVVAGALLSVIMPTPELLEPFSLSSTITYSLVGFLTNAIAINMLFKPYNEIKALRNVPILKHLSMGYIPRNKAVLADSMSQAIDTYLLSKDSLNELFDIYEANIKQSLTNSIAKDDFANVKNLFDKNIDNIVNMLNKAIHSYIIDNESMLCDMMYKQLNKADLIKLIEDKKDYLVRLCSKNNPKASSYVSDKLSVAASKFTSSSDSISKFVPNEISEKIYLSLDRLFKDNIYKLFDKLNYNSVESFALRYDERYNTLMSKRVCDIIPKPSMDKVNSVLSDSLSKLMNDETISKKLIGYINKYLSSDCKLDEVLGGKVKSTVDNLLYKYYSNVQGIAQELLSKYRFKVALIVQNKVTENMNFLVRGAYASVGGDKIIAQAVEKFMCEKMPVLIEKKKDMIFKDVIGFVDNKLLKTTLSDIGLSINEDNAINVARNANLACDIKLEDIGNGLIDYIRTEAQCTTLGQLLSQLDLDSIHSIFENNKVIIENILKSLSVEVQTNSKDIEDTICQLASDMLDNTLKAVTIKELFSNISMNEIVTITDRLTDILLNDKEVEKAFEIIIEQFNSNENKLTVDKLISDKVFDDIATKAINRLVDNNLVKEEINSILNKLLVDFSEDNFKVIDKEAKDYIVDIIIDASILALRNNLIPILKDIQFDKIAKEQVNAMSAKKIHKMFNSFAGKYFRTLMLYGLFGAIFGVNTILGLVLSAAYGVKNLYQGRHKNN